MKQEFNYIKIENGKIIEGKANLRGISKELYFYEDNAIIIDKYHNFNGVRVVYASSDSKCQEVLEKSVQDEIRTLTIGLDEMKGRV